MNDDGKQFLERYGKAGNGAGWYSFDKKGVHFIGLVNVLNLKAGGLGTLGGEQLAWLEKDVKHLKGSGVGWISSPSPSWKFVVLDSPELVVLHPKVALEDFGCSREPQKGGVSFGKAATGEDRRAMG